MKILQGSYEIVDAIQWHEGMLLAPQHFQQLSLRQEQLLYYTTRMIAPFSWGIRHIKIDSVLLLSGQLRIAELEAIMPDGLIIACDTNDDSDLHIDLVPYLDQIKCQALTVYLCVPAYTAESLATIRYQSIEGKSVMDANTGEGSLAIPRLKPRLSLLIGEEPPGRFSYFPITEITYKNEVFALTEFVPPTLIIHSHSPLGEIAKQLATRIREKALFLTERLRSPDAMRMSKPMIFDTKNILQGLIAALPPLEGMLYANASHPYHLYLGLCAVAGNMSVFTGSMVPPVFPAYDHNNLYISFQAVCRFIHELLDHIHESFIAVPFHYQDDRFSLMPQPRWLDDRHFVIGVRRPTGSTENDVINWIGASLICSGTKINAMRGKRILGAQRLRVEKAEDFELLAPRDMLLFRVDMDKQFIEPEQMLCILNEYHDSHRPAEIVFYVKT